MSELHLVLVAATFLLAGMVKGVIGFGLPTVSLGLLVMIVELPTAMALMIVPSLATNLWQSLSGGNILFLLRKVGLFLAAATLTVWLGSKILSSIDLVWATVVLGVLLIIYASLQILGFTIAKPKRQYKWIAVVAGLINGVFTGLTGAFIFPGLMYLQSLDLKKDQLVQAMGMLFMLSTIALAIALKGHGLLDMNVGWVSVGAVISALLGMSIGRRLREYLSEVQFRKTFFLSILALGVIIILTALTK